jgi:hypothetical protein
MKIGLLLKEEKSGKPLGLIEFDAMGMLILRGFKGEVHVNALNCVLGLLEKNGLNEPLYKKYAYILKKQSSLSEEILQREATFYAELINHLIPAPQIIDQNYRTIVVRYS